MHGFNARVVVGLGWAVVVVGVGEGVAARSRVHDFECCRSVGRGGLHRCRVSTIMCLGAGGGASSMQSFDWWWAFGFVGRGVLFFCWGVGASSMQGLDWQGVRGVVAGLFFQTRSAFSRLQKYGHQIGLKSMCAGVCGGGGGV